eukprot:352355-Chlamydomonas_euryale.AAC.1
MRLRGQRVLAEADQALNAIGRVRQPPHFPHLRLELARQDLDERRLACAVSADDGDAAAEAAVERDAGELRLCGSG